jgi:deoxycytidylate deaminase
VALKKVFNKRSFVMAILKTTGSLTKSSTDSGVFYAINTYDNCAEVNAMLSAIKHGATKFESILIIRLITDIDGNISYGLSHPCPFCSRVFIQITKIQKKNLKIYYSIPGGIMQTLSDAATIMKIAEVDTSIKDYQNVLARRDKEQNIVKLLQIWTKIQKRK